MKLKTAKNLLLLSRLIMAILLVICSVTKILWLGYLGIAFVFAGAFIWILFGRCPSCGRFLGKVDNKYCPHCGERIEWQQKKDPSPTGEGSFNILVETIGIEPTTF